MSTSYPYLACWRRVRDFMPDLTYGDVLSCGETLDLRREDWKPRHERASQMLCRHRRLASEIEITWTREQRRRGSI